MVAQTVKQVIEWIYSFSGDYGVTIVLVTAVIRMLLIPLNIQQRKQMRRQQETGREAEKLKEKYKKNPQKLNEEMQKLYQERGYGLSGCLMNFVQVPIMVGLYYFISGLFTAAEQLLVNGWNVRRPAQVLH